jgi:hypothetical protein
MPLMIGERVANLTFQRADGTSVRLAEYTAKALVLIFLRHLA